MRHLTCGLVLASLVGAASCDEAGGARSTPPAPLEIETLELAPTEARDTGEYLGSLLSRDSVRVRPQVSGYVRAIHVRPGMHVERGTPLIEIDSGVEAAALESARAQRSSASARLDLARQTAARANALYEEGLATAEEVERARADVDALEAQIRVAEASVSQQNVRLQYHSIRSAVTGTVGDVLVRTGDYVTPADLVTTISRSKVLELTIAVPPDRARQIPPNAPIELLDRDGDVLVTSHVFFVAPEASVSTQLVEVKGILENTVGLRPSELVRVRLVYATERALQIPVLAVVRQSGQAFAFVVREDGGTQKVERRPIELGALGDDSYVVEQGLEAGDRIAISGIQKLRDGRTVAPVERPRG